jgi:hypothetical protein
VPERKWEGRSLRGLVAHEALPELVIRQSSPSRSTAESMVLSLEGQSESMVLSFDGLELPAVSTGVRSACRGPAVPSGPLSPCETVEVDSSLHLQMPCRRFPLS